MKIPKRRTTGTKYIIKIPFYSALENKPLVELIKDDKKIPPLFTKGGIALKDINPRVTSGSLQFNHPLETIRQFQSAGGLTFRILKIEQGINLDKILGAGK